MTSDATPPREAYVWIWLSGRMEPVVAGRIRAEGPRFIFNYRRPFLSRADAIALHLRELPLRPGAETRRDGARTAARARPGAWAHGAEATPALSFRARRVETAQMTSRTRLAPAD